MSVPFEQDQELSGFFRFEAWISIDQPDTDFVVTVAEVGPNGTVTPLSSDIMRARCRESRLALTLQHWTGRGQYQSAEVHQEEYVRPSEL